MVARLAWWPNMSTDIADWADKCWVCCRYRKRPLKVQAGQIVSLTLLL